MLYLHHDTHILHSPSHFYPCLTKEVPTHKLVPHCTPILFMTTAIKLQFKKKTAIQDREPRKHENPFVTVSRQRRRKHRGGPFVDAPLHAPPSVSRGGSGGGGGGGGGLTLTGPSPVQTAGQHNIHQPTSATLSRSNSLLLKTDSAGPRLISRSRELMLLKPTQRYT